MSQEAVTVSLDDLKSESIPFETLEEAFGPSSLGILIVKDLPSKFVPLRHKLLSYASYLANLPPEELTALSCPSAKYLVGWSHGKEALRNNHYDTLKGSYYINCAFYHDPTLQSAPASPSANFPEYTTPNIWPREALLPGFRATFEELCTLIIDTAVLVAKACDRYAVAHMPGYEAGYLEHVVSTSRTTKARLLHYFPPAASASPAPPDPDSWCATHLDHGCLTGLTAPLYLAESSPSPPRPRNPPRTPDPLSGLYILTRASTPTQILIPASSLAFQTGEALEVITGGKFRAVPHFVRGPRPGWGDGVARNTLAVFTQPDLGLWWRGSGGDVWGVCEGVVGRFG
ncbi:MAG: hypothetical protein FRX48_00595 [Lasallia pustulata]|uniref:Clavaminate synthase-like protein n=1 Tax=Lasallia pustulata TaxID=136370 RepID=A0A5M8Q141_9LECA|nr:MAG: hypothetical protein FRX48_00595 [Lasallia pustulata]